MRNLKAVTRFLSVMLLVASCYGIADAQYILPGRAAPAAWAGQYYPSQSAYRSVVYRQPAFRQVVNRQPIFHQRQLSSPVYHPPVCDVNVCNTFVPPRRSYAVCMPSTSFQTACPPVSSQVVCATPTISQPICVNPVATTTTIAAAPTATTVTEQAVEGGTTTPQAVTATPVSYQRNVTLVSCATAGCSPVVSHQVIGQPACNSYVPSSPLCAPTPICNTTPICNPTPVCHTAQVSSNVCCDNYPMVSQQYPSNAGYCCESQSVPYGNAYASQDCYGTPTYDCGYGGYPGGSLGGGLVEVNGVLVDASSYRNQQSYAYAAQQRSHSSYSHRSSYSSQGGYGPYGAYGSYSSSSSSSSSSSNSSSSYRSYNQNSSRSHSTRRVGVVRRIFSRWN